MNITEILNKRYQYENLVSYRKTFDLPSYQGDIDSLTYFINNGHKNNRFRKNFKPAMNLAKEIVQYYEENKNQRSLELLDQQLAGQSRQR
jgi:hypothetical protein